MIDLRQPDYTNHPASENRRGFSFRPRSPQVPVTVSILTPFYNTGEIFLETLQSVVHQSFQEWEWIIVDDGSNDALTTSLLAQVASADSRIRIFRQPNQGPSVARNKASELANGRYFCLLDSDDLLEPTFLEKTLWFLESQPAFAFCNSRSVYFGKQQFLNPAGFERGKDFINANSGPPISVIRSEAYKSIKGFDETILFGHEDWDFWLALAKQGHWGYTLAEYLEWYRVQENSRYAQILAAGTTHSTFIRSIEKKYSSMRESFPSPQLKVPQPFEAPNLTPPFQNLLAAQDDPKRILFLIPWMVTGGADRVNLDWLRELTNHGYQISVCATLRAEHEWMPEFTEQTSDVFILPNFLHPSDIPRFLVYLIKSRQVNTVLMSHCTLAYQLLPFLRSSCPAVSFVDLCHVDEPDWLNGGHPRFAAGYQDLLDLNIVTTRHLQEWMTARGADVDRIEVCYSGLSSGISGNAGETRHAARAALGIPADIPLLVFGGRLCPQKRPELLARILADLAQINIPFHCAVVGTGELAPLLKARVRQLGLDSHVTLLGGRPHKEWLSILSAGDIFFLPSQYEGISVALFEAMAMGVVPVMSDVGGQSEVVTPDCGILIPLGEGEVEAYVAALVNLIQNPEARRAMAQAGRLRIANSYTLDHTTPRLIEALDRAETLARTEPRQAVPPRFAKELATLAVEYARMTTARPFRSQLGKALAFVRTYKVGRVLLRMEWVQRAGHWLLDKIRNR